MNKVLRITLRRLEYWIFGGQGSKTLVEALHALESLTTPIDVLKWDPRTLAYVLFRIQLEEMPYINSSLELPECCLCRLPKVSWVFWESRLPRGAFRSVLFGLFAGLYHTIIRARRCGELDIGQLHSSADRLVAMVWHLSETGLASGFVAFPPIEGMPTATNAPWRQYRSNPCQL